ncbi:hypothetical protein QCM80_18205 [Bradyrhizobium sp. SSUT112]|nr:hypothetical protein [Bradyrhizobium sp. SSUT112]MDH2352571.1 hypothetical protein [Bradyrhizobium sp. SSUT112]
MIVRAGGQDAGRYIAGLPKAEHDAPEWLAAMEALLLVVERGGPTMLARIGIMRAVNAGKPNLDLVPRRKREKAYPRHRMTKSADHRNERPGGPASR